MQKILLGQKVKDLVSGAEGIVTQYTQCMHGCPRIVVQAPGGADGKIPDVQEIDLPQLQVLDEKQVIATKFEESTIKLGQEVLDPVSGYKGTVIGACEFINGCRRFGVQAKYDPKALIKDSLTSIWFNEFQLKVTKDIPKEETKKLETSQKKGGPGMMSTYKNVVGRM
jgi:hypothetical protein